MNTVTQQNAANSEESAAAAEELRGQAEELAAMVATFSLTNTSGGSSRASSRALVKPATRVTSLAKAPAPAQKATARKSAQAGPVRIPKEARGGKTNTVIPLDDDDLKEF
jgi:hypothetical protein